MTETTTAQLDYAHPTRQRRRRWKLWVGLTLLLCVIALVVIRYGADAMRRIRFARYQRQCMTYTAPPMQVVYTNDPGEAAKLLASGAGYVSKTGRDAYLNPLPWKRFNATRHVSMSSDGTIFLHERTTPSGGRVLLMGELVLRSKSAMFSFIVTIPGNSPGRVGGATHGDISIPLAPSDKLRVSAGQPDPNDPSHFTFVYELNGKQHTIDGWAEDGSSVLLERTDSPERLKRDMKKALEHNSG